MSNKDKENIYYISEDSDDMNETDKIIIQKAKVFRNEKDAIRLFLSDHFREFRYNFFLYLKQYEKGVYGAIKREIKNCLNPYRIFIKQKNQENEEELKKLYEELKRYYKQKNFNNTFFINYFKDLKQAHRKMVKSKFINMIPKNEEEALNDIHRKVLIIKSLNRYITETIVNRLQHINLDKNHEIGNKDEFIMKYKYLVIKREIFSDLKEEDLIQYISNQQGSLKLRRALKDFNDYNYIPIICKGHCKQEADLFIQFLEKEFYKNHQNCKECEYLKNNLDNIKSQIRSLYIKTCVFSHNINEIMFHPLFFLSFENMPFYFSELKNHKTNPKIKNIIETGIIPNKYLDKHSYKISKMYNESESSMKEIIKLLRDYSIKSNLFGGSCFLPDYKIKKCPLDFLKPNKEDWNYHMSKCPYYHSNLEKRRIIKIKKNKICPNAIHGKEWVKDTEEINCEDGENCDRFHTRNELFYDERNFRKLYPCTEYNIKNANDNINFCKKYDMCPKKHPIDIKIDEIYLPSDYKSDLQKELKGLKEKDKNVGKKIEKMKKVECRCCLNYIDGEEERQFIYFTNCNHIICSSCFNACKLYPFCDLKSDQPKIVIKLKTNEDNNESNDNSNNSHNGQGEESSSEEEEEEDDEDEEDNEVQPDLDDLFGINDPNNLMVSYTSKNNHEYKKIEEKNEKSNEIMNDEESDKKGNSKMVLSYSYSNNDDSIEENMRGTNRKNYRGNFRGRGGERGRMRVRGRRVVRSRGVRGRGYY